MRPGAGDPRAALRALAPGSLVVAMPDPPDPAARRIALALLEEAAVLGGGHVTQWPGAQLLLGASRTAAARASAALGRLLGTEPRQWGLPAEAAALDAWLDQLPQPPPQPANLAALEARCAALPVEGLARLTFFAEGDDPRPVAQRLAPVDLGLEDPDLRAQARALLCRRLLAALTDPAQQGRLPHLRAGLRLLLDLPLAGLAGGRMMGGSGGRMAPIALLPLAALAEPGFRALSDGLAGAGWRLGFVSKDREALGLLRGGEHPLAAPPPEAAPPALPTPMTGAPRFIALGPAIPAWCRAPGLLWELPA